MTSGVREREPRALARALSLIESGHPRARALLSELSTHPLSSGRTSHVIGLTGPPGVGKSTTTNALVEHLRARQAQVAVLAVDPSSPFTGGALLGDRIRMSGHSLDPGVYIRSMAARGHLGGLAAAVPQAIRLLEAAGFDAVLLETVGVGQSEVDIAARADTTVVLLAPGMGDGVQAAKAGILEIADVFAVNKADREGADATVRDVRALVRMTSRPQGAWRAPVVKLAARDGEGIGELLAAIDAHLAYAREHRAWRARRQARAAAEIEQIVMTRLRERIHDAAGAGARDVTGGRCDPETVAERIVATFD